MTMIYIFTHFGLSIRHTFIYFVSFVRLCLYNREISLAVMLKQLSKQKNNMTKNHDIQKKRLNGDIFAKLPTPSRGGPKPYTSSPPPAPVQDCALVMPFRPCPSRGLCMPLLSNILSSYKKTVKSKLIYPFVENKPNLAFYLYCQSSFIILF